MTVKRKSKARAAASNVTEDDGKAFVDAFRDALLGTTHERLSDLTRRIIAIETKLACMAAVADVERQRR